MRGGKPHGAALAREDVKAGPPGGGRMVGGEGESVATAREF